MRDITNKIKHFFFGGYYFRKELKAEIRFLILFSLGFTIAFTWRQTTFDFFQSIVRWLTHIEGNATLSILTSILTTIVCLAVIFITSKLLKEASDNN